jgi:hypothetical protein
MEAVFSRLKVARPTRSRKPFFIFKDVWSNGILQIWLVFPDKPVIILSSICTQMGFLKANLSILPHSFVQA